ncbi:MAG TPA: UrcA family protein [Steroidobacteraceae bacterium]|nr:UrcA family protein [Steroidobacteraceae bacterium]
MSKKLITAGTVAAAAVAANVIAQNVPMPEVIVETHRMVSTRIGTTSSGIPIKDVSMGYTVTAEGLDISTEQGARAFEARISQAAMAACQEIGRRFRNARPSDAECARQATDRAMAQVRQAEDAAAKGK